MITLIRWKLITLQRLNVDLVVTVMHYHMSWSSHRVTVKTFEFTNRNLALVLQQKYQEEFQQAYKDWIHLHKLQQQLINIREIKLIRGWHRCWWRILERRCVGDNFEMFVTVLTVFVTNILYLSTLACGASIQKLSPR